MTESEGHQGHIAMSSRCWVDKVQGENSIACSLKLLLSSKAVMDAVGSEGIIRLGIAPAPCSCHKQISDRR